MGQLIRVEGVTKGSHKVFLFGQEGSTELQINQGLRRIAHNQLKEKVIYCRNTKDDVFITVNQGNNNLEVTDLKTGRNLKILRGYPEKPYGNQKPPTKKIPLNQFPLIKKTL
jgi:hypothetical protein